MNRFSYNLDPPAPVSLGLIVLQSDETIECDMRRLLPAEVPFHVSRVPSGREVSSDSLQEMEGNLPAAAALLPRSVAFDVIGYGCTSGTAQIGAHAIASQIRRGAPTTHVSEPVSALVAACTALGIARLAFLSPYVGEVSVNLRRVLADGGIETPVFGTFDEAEEARVAHIAPASIMAAALELAGQGGIDALFLSCTNLRTLDIITPLAERAGLPVLSSNLVLGWHMCRLAGIDMAAASPGILPATGL